MGWFSFKCPQHDTFIVALQKRQKMVKCPKCGADSAAIIKIGTTQIVEKLDNGVMGRSVERLHNIEEIIKNRADADDQANNAIEFAGREKEDSEE